MANFRMNLSQLGKVCGRDIEEIQYVEMQSHGHTHGLQLEAVSLLELVDVTHYRQFIGSLTRHLFYCEHLKSISCSTKTGSPSSCKTCDEISERDYRLWYIL